MLTGALGNRDAAALGELERGRRGVEDDLHAERGGESTGSDPDLEAGVPACGRQRPQAASSRPESSRPCAPSHKAS
jgi:hypothetical protein